MIIMEPISLNQSINNLIKVLVDEKEKLSQYKNVSVKSNQFEEASSYRDMERDLEDLIIKINPSIKFK